MKKIKRAKHEKLKVDLGKKKKQHGGFAQMRLVRGIIRGAACYQRTAPVRRLDSASFRSVLPRGFFGWRRSVVEEDKAGW